MAGGTVMTLIAPTLQAFFTDRLLQQRQASPQTVASYRDTLRHREQDSMIRRYIAWRNRHTADPRLRRIVKRAGVA